MLGDSRAPATRNAGSIARTAASSSTSRSSTPFCAAFALIPASVSTSPASCATISLPSRACGTPRSAQYSYRRCFPSTQNRAFRLPVG